MMQSFLCIIAVFYYEVNQVSALKVITKKAETTQQDFKTLGSQGSIPYKNTMLLLQSVRPDRMELMNKVYGKWFGSVKFMVWGNENPELEELDLAKGDERAKAMAEAKLQGRLPGEIEDEFDGALPHDALNMMLETSNLREQIIYCPRSERLTYQSACLAPFLKQMSGSDVTGVLTMHMDFWIDPSRLMEGANLNEIWQLEGGLKVRQSGHWQGKGPLCYQSEQAMDVEGKHIPQWGWWHNSKSQSKSALRSFKAALKDNPSLLQVPDMDVLETCAGWSDMFYLPKSAWHHFVNIAPFYKDVFHESAVPTILSHLKKAEVVAQISLKSCGGGCCQLSDISDAGHACGHRFDFASPNNRIRWEKWMDGLLANSPNKPDNWFR